MRLPLRLCLSLAAVSLSGCASFSNFYGHLVGNTQPVTPDEFMNRQSSEDKSETLNGDAAMPVAQQPPKEGVPPPKTPTIDKAVAQVVQHDQTQPTTQQSTSGAAATAAATEPSLASGEYLSMGGVVADVNGTPIYINKVLQLVWPTLHSDARSMDADHYFLAARDEIQRQIEVLESDELLYAAAEHSLDNDDHKLVADLTTAYRQHLITLAGGSLEMARRKAVENGDDFDQVVSDQHRRYMIELYQQRKFSPLIEPTATDLRTYYRQNADKMFTDHSEVGFDLIKIDPSLLGGDSAEANRKLAFDRAKQAHDRAAAGVKWATLFAEYNNAPGLVALTSGTGNMGVMERGTFAIKEVEDAVWNLQPGQVTDVLDVNGVLYIAKMESRKQGQVHPFEDEEVQTQIAAAIRRERFARYYDEERQRLLDEAIRHVYPEMFQTAVDISMQSYRIWNAK